MVVVAVANVGDDGVGETDGAIYQGRKQQCSRIAIAFGSLSVSAVVV